MHIVTRLALAALIAVAAPAAGAHEFKLGDLTIAQAWVRVIITNRPGAAYVRIDNAGAAADRLIGVSTPSAERAEIHTHIMENNVASMRKVEAIEVPAHGTATLAPGGGHIMLFGLDAELAEGKTMALTLQFEHAGSIEVEVPILREAPEGAMMDGQADHSGHGSD